MVGKLIQFLLFICNIIVAVLLLASLLAGFFRPDKISFTSTLPLLFPYLFVANIVFLMLWAFMRKRYFSISLGCLLLSIPSLNSSFPLFKGKNDIRNAATEISLLSYNTMACFNYQKHTTHKPNKGIEYILALDADIVCLQEVSVRNSKPKEFITDDDLLIIFKKYKYRHVWYRNPNQQDKSMGLTIFSKYPIVNKQSINLSTYNGAVYSDININGDTIRVFNVHLESNKVTGMDKVMAQKLKDNFDTENLSELTQYFSRKLGEAAVIRSKQADLIAENISKSPYKVVLCGDFNDVPLSYTCRTLKKNLSDAFVKAGSGLGLTYSNGLYQLRIDYIMHDKQLKAFDFRVDNVNYSDHYPISCHLQFN